jgi:hypothetical protein
MLVQDTVTVWCNFLHTHIFIFYFDHNTFDSFIAIYRFLFFPRYVLKNNNCEPEDDLSGRNILFCR